jgi:hypothetical protein
MEHQDKEGIINSNSNSNSRMVPKIRVSSIKSNTFNSNKCKGMDNSRWIHIKCNKCNSSKWWCNNSKIKAIKARTSSTILDNNSARWVWLKETICKWIWECNSNFKVVSHNKWTKINSNSRLLHNRLHQLLRQQQLQFKLRLLLTLRQMTHWLSY